MRRQAGNFAACTKQVWTGTRNAEENAVIRARRLQAERLRLVSYDFWITTPDDVPIALWRFPDGSHYLISDDGSMIAAAFTKGTASRPTFQELV